MPPKHGISLPSDTSLFVFVFGGAIFDFVFVFGRAFNLNRSFLSFNSSLASFFSAFPISFILASFWGSWASSYSSSPLISLSLQRASISLFVPFFRSSLLILNA